ncbi:hypothetical protein [Pedobacter sp. ASV12]|uniref:hypothetical protein n=1 Tax=Pedobacter sp. ASV12 TaxID=2795120 RepID=UPI0018EC0CCC|nr:hypothetical protein [Pedobacter sp. ASV12]
MKLIYTLFFCLSLLMLFINLNRPELINRKIAIGLWIVFVLIVALHFVIKTDFMLPAKVVQIPVMGLVFIVLAHYIAEWQKESANKSQMSDEIKSLRIKMTSIMFQRIIYAFVFLLILISLAN